MSKQQEFLDKLKDPVKVRLKEAVRYYQTFNNKIRIVFVEEDSKRYVIDIMANTRKAIDSATIDFGMMLGKFIDKPAVNTRLRAYTNHPYTYRRSFYILKKP